jgi:hypothetical protein
MRNRLLSSARLSADVGRRIAGELQGVFARERELQLVKANEDRRLTELTGSLRHAVYEAVESFNLHSPWDFHLAVLDKGDRLIFNSLGEFTLTMRYGDGRLTMEQVVGGRMTGEAMVVEVWLTHDGLRFRDCSVLEEPAPSRNLDQVAFLARMIRMACSPKFYSLDTC